MLLLRFSKGLIWAAVLLMSTLSAFAAEESVCFGETRNGHLLGGIRLPRTGLNFSAYSDLGWIVGRTYVQFSTRRSWVRHDEHYHVDFIVKCRANRS